MSKDETPKNEADLTYIDSDSEYDPANVSKITQKALIDAQKMQNLMKSSFLSWVIEKKVADKELKKRQEIIDFINSHGTTIDIRYINNYLKYKNRTAMINFAKEMIDINNQETNIQEKVNFSIIKNGIAQLRLYSSDDQLSTGGEIYSAANAFLRTEAPMGESIVGKPMDNIPDEDDKSIVSEMINGIDALFNIIPKQTTPSPQSLLLFRGLQSNYLQNPKNVYKTLRHDNNYLSASLNLEIALKFFRNQDSAFNTRGIIVGLYIPQTYQELLPIYAVSNVPTECEILLPRDCSLTFLYSTNDCLRYDGTLLCGNSDSIICEPKEGSQGSLQSSSTENPCYIDNAIDANIRYFFEVGMPAIPHAGGRKRLPALVSAYNQIINYEKKMKNPKFKNVKIITRGKNKSIKNQTKRRKSKKTRRIKKIRRTRSRK